MFSFLVFRLARSASSAVLNAVICAFVLMFAGGLGDLYTEDSRNVFLWILASMVMLSKMLSVNVESSSITLKMIEFLI